ncbi:hypothetical protein B0A49_00296 [Cryomyces minteri]|uniref:GOLD domain-containing protein n=1 Tax=Cryomyces minteri TaxID=331657 RepID=A0A4U0Y0F5_9PEZI|nr:hypothetical protein B0A49_00296 [Cryomyces minteri]
MLLRLTAVLAAFATLLPLSLAHNIQMKAHSRECFHEELHKDDRMTVTFQVGDRESGGSGNLDVDFWIQNPANSYQVHERAVSSGDHSFVASMDGRYTYCFSNEHWSANTKEVSFNVHGIVYVPESEAPQDPLEKEVRQLSELLAQVKDEQSYIVVRERTHRNTAESTNARVKWWSIFQLGVLIGEGVFQVWWLKRFFEVKRVLHECAYGDKALKRLSNSRRVFDTEAAQSACIAKSAILCNVAQSLCGHLHRSTDSSFFLVEKVLVLTADGRTLTGTLLSCDQLTNLVLQDTVERVIRSADDPKPSIETEHGVYLIRGDNVLLIGLVDEELDNSIDWTKVKGEVVGGIKHV